MYLSEPYSDFFSSSCFVSLQICVTSAQSCSKTLWCLWIRLRVFHLPSTSCCQRQTVPLPNRRQEFRHLSEGKIRFWVSVTVQALLVLLTRLSLRRPRLEDWSVLWVIQSQTLEEKPFSKTSVLIQQNKVFQEFHIGLFKKQTLKSNLTK